MFKGIKRNEKGFTLVELVVVIAILAILAALLVPRIMGNVDEARKNSELTKARTVAGEIAIWNAKEMVKSPTDTPAPDPIKAGTGATLTINGTHLTKMKMDPVKDLPDPTVATVVVDDNGNAKVVVTAPTPTP